MDGDATGAGITVVADLFPRASYGAPFDPAIFPQNTPWTGTLWPLYTDLAVKTASSALLVAIDDALTYGPVVYTGPGHDRAVLYETYRPNDRAVAQLAAPEHVNGAHAFNFLNDADYLFFASVGSFNYGHFLVDDLPRLKAVELLRASNGGRRIVIVMISHGPAIDRIRTDAIRRIAGTMLEIRLLPQSETFRFERLLYATPVSSHPVEKNPLALDYVVQAAKAAMGIDQTPRSKLLVLRKSSTVRALVNQKELVDRLVPLGFEPLHTDDLSFEDQVRRFAGAAIIVGQMGAAMTNTMFAPAAAKLVYLAPAGWIEPFYWDLSLARRQSYRAVYGPVTQQGRPVHDSDFAVSLDAVLAAID
ncbi:glycosyltransferase family 61 protein [Sphingomonas sp. Leaf17]|uniref:glycosyltransferase family 61 protein n=1 Tax=Sphingomonas sp. Leaf17 TaxID=1735683 RepID=UPI00138ECAF3|nr:glycosyltransferase family 61 protein [Sphingomonas sp. Leaf17]